MSGRKLVEFMEVIFHNFIRWLVVGFNPGDFVQRPKRRHRLSLFAVCIKLCSWYIVILFPQTIQASAMLLSKKMPEPMHLCADSWLGPSVKFSHSSLGKLANLSTDKHPKNILG